MRRFTLASCLATAMATASLSHARTQALVDTSALTIEPAPADWVQALSELTAAVAGTYGDEGPRIGAALDRMTAALAEWDRDIQALEGRLASAQRGASSHAVVDLRLTLARTYIERGRLSDAERELELANGPEPQRADLHVLRGLALEASNQFTEAGKAFRAAWAAGPGDPINAYHVFRHASTGNASDAQRAREVLVAAYSRLLEDGRHAKASPFSSLHPLQDRAEETPALSPAAYAQGYAFLAHRRYDQAIAEFRKAAAADPLVTDPAAPSTRQAIAALREGRMSEARTLLEGSTALPGSSEAHRLLGQIYWLDSQDGKSLEHLAVAIRRNPRDERSRIALARVLSSTGRGSDAERVLQETIQVLPDSALAHWWLGVDYERLGRFTDARQEFELAATGVVAGRGLVFASIGRLASSAADFPGAVEAFERSIGARPNDPSVHKQLAGAFLQQDRVDEAFMELVAALLIDPLDAGAHAGIGQSHLNAGRYDKAVSSLRRAVDLSPNYTEARYALATALMRGGSPQEAARELERVAQEQRQALADRRRNMSLDVLKEEAALHISDGRFDTAIARYEQALTLGADPAVYRDLAALYAKVGRADDAARTRVMYEKALRGEPSPKGTSR
jgi:tetratricopeptide (TPR) repeat protein